MPEENYNFKPTDDVRGYGQIVGHVADSQYYFCSIVLGEKDPRPRIGSAFISICIGSLSNWITRIAALVSAQSGMLFARAHRQPASSPETAPALRRHRPQCRLRRY